MRLILSAILMALFYVACSPGTKMFATETEAGTDFSKYKTYALLPTDDTSYAKMVNKQLFEQYLAQAGIYQIEKKRLVKDSLHPDCYFKYTMVMNRKYETSQQSQLVYKPEVYTPAFDNNARIYYFSSDNRPVIYKGKMEVSTFREGALIIDMIDAATKNVVWRTSYTYKHDEAALPTLKTAVDIIVPALFKKFPVK